MKKEYIAEQLTRPFEVLVSFFGGLLVNLGACWDRGPDLDLDQGLTIMTHIALTIHLRMF